MMTSSSSSPSTSLSREREKKKKEDAEEVNSYATLRAWMVVHHLPVERRCYDITRYVRESPAFKSMNYKKPFTYVKGLETSYEDIEEYDFVSFYPTVYRSLMRDILPITSEQHKNYFTLFDTVTRYCETNKSTRKRILNIIYGLFQCEYSIFYCKELGALTRSKASEIMRSLFRNFEESVVYGYVDSLFFARGKEFGINEQSLAVVIKDAFPEIEGLSITKRKSFQRVTFYSTTSYVALSTEGEEIRKGTLGRAIKKKREAAASSSSSPPPPPPPPPQPSIRQEMKKLFGKKYDNKNKNFMIYLYKKKC